MTFRIVFFIFIVYLLLFAGPSAFRDGAHFYAPQFQYIFEEIFAGRFPLWNPYENLGQPLAANPAAMLFYPLFYIAAVPPVLSWLNGYASFPALASGAISEGYTLFLSIHLLLALWTSYRLARTWGCGRNASTAAAVCYTLSGSVWFQWHNAPFLVSAAWFPESLRTALRLSERRKIKYAVRYAVILSLLITGGDPQAAYHSVLCAAVFFILTAVRSAGKVHYAGKVLFLFIFSCILAFLLSAILILPAMEFSRNSERSLPDFREYVYWFSVPPWRLAELCFPNIGGRQFPVHTRWFDALPENGIWTPSLYIGMLPVILAGLGLCSALKHRDTKNSAAAALLVFFILGSLGNWFFVYPALRYLPFYDSFRYPGKLMSVAALFIALFAAAGIGRVFCENAEKRKNRCASLMKIYTGAVFVVSLLILSVMLLPLNVSANVLFGPFDKEQECFLLLHTICFIWLFYFIIYFVIRCPLIISKTLLTAVILADLFVHNHWFFAAEKINRQPVLRSTVLEGYVPNYGIEPLRIYRYPVWEPQHFGKTSSSKRLAEIIEWNKATLFPKYTLPKSALPKPALPKRINTVDVRGTAMPKDYYLFMKELRRKIYEAESKGYNVFPLEKELAMLGVDYVIAPSQTIFKSYWENKDAFEIDVRIGIIENAAKRNFTVYEPNRIEFNVSLEKPETVVITEQYWNNWRAFDGGAEYGAEIPVRKAEPCFRSIDLPAGKHHIVMIYDPPLFKTGAVLSITGLIIAGLTFIIPACRRIRISSVLPKRI